MNYFVAHATTNTFVWASGGSSAYSALIIGAPNLSAIFTVLFHCWVVNGEDNHRNSSASVHLIRNMLLLCSLFGFLGNMTHAIAVNHNNIPLAVFGRFLLGFSSGTMLERHVVSFCRPSHVVPVTARLVQYRLVGIVAGLLVGSATELIPITIGSIGVRAVQSASWLMMASWTLLCFVILQQVWPVNVQREKEYDVVNTGSDKLSGSDQFLQTADASEFQSDSSDETDGIETPPGMYYAASSDGIASNPLVAKLGTVSSMQNITKDASADDVNVIHRIFSSVAPTKRPSPLKQLQTFVIRVRKLLALQVSLPICFLIVFYTSFSLEVFFTATPIVTRRYFAWSGTHAAGLLGSFAIFTFPAIFLSEKITRRYEERTVIRVGDVSSCVPRTCDCYFRVSSWPLIHTFCRKRYSSLDWVFLS